MSFEINPLTQVYDALWEMVDRHPQSAMIKAGNRINFGGGSSSPEKPVIRDADVPELILVSDGGLVNLMSTSSSTKVVRRYAWMISTGDKQLNRSLYQVEWFLMIAMLQWKTVLSALEYNGLNFVTQTKIVSVTEGMSDGKMNRNLSGWSSLWRCEVEMHFKTSDLLAELSP